MIVTNKYFILIFALLISFSCATTSKKESTENQKEDGPDLTEEKKTEKKEKKGKVENKETSEDSDSESKLEQEQEINKKESDKESKKKRKADHYDGLKYTGPAQNKFSEGIGKYFTDGCDAAVKLWKDALDRDKENNSIAFNIALCYQRMKNFEESRKWYEKAYLLNPEFVRPLYNLALMLGDKIKQEEKYFADIIEKTEDIVEKNNFIAWVYLQTGKLDLTEKHAKMVLKEDEQNAEAVISLATVYYTKKMYELAESALITAEKWDSDNFRLQRLYGFLAYETGDKNKANIHLQKALKINPELSEVRNILAVLAMEIEDFSTAKDHLEFALKITPDFKHAKMNLALAYKGLNEFKKAKDILIELENDKNISENMRKSVLFNMAILYLDSDVDGDKNPNRYDVAIDYFDKYLKTIAKSKEFKNEKNLIDGYKKEAVSEKKKLQMLLARQAKADKRKKELEEEHKLFLANKEKAFENAIKEDKVEIWEKYLQDFPIIDENDKLSNAAKARLGELKGNQESKTKEGKDIDN